MKKIFLVALILLTSQKIFGNDTLYYSMLRKSIDLAYRDYKLENYRQLANCSERILLVYKNDWLPYYYEALAYINMSFIETKEGDKEMYCDKAQNLLDGAFKIKPDESEIYVLQSMLYYARMSISPMINGPLYLPKAASALNDAEKLDPENPRIYYLRGKSTMNTPKFFGGGKDTAVPILEKALNMYEKYKQKSTVHPDWGSEEAERLYHECKADSIRAESVKTVAIEEH
jgi:tetratricopeptide (TPR) repeat protein